MKETLSTYQLSLELCSVIAQNIEEATSSEGKADGIGAYSENMLDTCRVLGEVAAEVWAQSGALPIYDDVFYPYDIDIKGIEKYFRAGDTRGACNYIFNHFSALEACNLVSSKGIVSEIGDCAGNISEIFEDMSIETRLKYACEIATNISLAIRFLDNKVSPLTGSNIYSDTYLSLLKEKISKRVEQDIFVRYKKDWGHREAPYEKEPRPLGVPALAGTVGGFIFGSLIEQGKNSSLPLLLAILLGGGVLGFIALLNAKERKEYDSSVAACKEENERKCKKFYEDYIGTFGYAGYECLVENTGNLEFAMNSIISSGYSLLSSPEFDFLPADYKFDPEVLAQFVVYFRNKRVSSVKEAINLYLQERNEEEYRRQMIELEKQKLAQQAYEAELRRQSEAERNALLGQLSEAVDELRRSNEDAEKARKEDMENLKDGLNEAISNTEKAKKKLSEAKFELDELKKKLDD